MLNRPNNSRKPLFLTAKEALMTKSELGQIMDRKNFHQHLSLKRVKGKWRVKK